MQIEERRPRMNLGLKLTLCFVALSIAAGLVAGGVAARASVALHQPLPWAAYAVVVALGTLLAALPVGLWVVGPFSRRLGRLVEISRSWLHGNLSLRSGSGQLDELGLLGRQLDLLAGHLEQDEQDLGRMREQNARLTDQVRALAVDEERERLARELHDRIKQHLFSLTMTASAIRSRLDAQGRPEGELTEMAHQAEVSAQTVQRELTRLIEDLRPVSLTEQGLAGALNDYTLLFGAREHILIYLDVQGNDALLPPSIAESLYRVAQEALHNVARHAHATRVDVKLRCLPELATLTVTDNGVGFDVQQSHRGLGLGNMQERMLAAGGRLQIESASGSGTTVRAEVGLGRVPRLSDDGAVGPEKERPNAQVDNWAWLGQRLVIPVGQTWPWLPADQLHLRQPLVERVSEPLQILPATRTLGLRRGWLLHWDPRDTAALGLWHHRTGYRWKSEGATWALRRMPGAGDLRRAVLLRNRQPLAALQSQGRLLHTWTEIIFDGRGYRIARYRESWDSYALSDEDGEQVLAVTGGHVLWVELCRAVPLPLLATVVAYVVDEADQSGTVATVV